MQGHINFKHIIHIKYTIISAFNSLDMNRYIHKLLLYMYFFPSIFIVLYRIDYYIN